MTEHTRRHSLLAHDGNGKAGRQVVSVSVNPVDPHLIMSAGNDHTARLSDLRVLSGGAASTSAPTAGASVIPQLQQCCRQRDDYVTLIVRRLSVALYARSSIAGRL